MLVRNCDSPLPATRARIDMINLEEPTLSAAATFAIDEGALSAIARPDGATHGSRNMTPELACPIGCSLRAPSVS